MNTFIENLYNSFLQNHNRICLQIGDETYTYSEVLQKSLQIRSQLEETNSSNVGLYLTYDVEMYASILAIWQTGKAYVPIHPEFPLARNENIIQQAEIKTLISSIEVTDHYKIPTIDTKKDIEVKNTSPIDFDMDENAYILFTSGSTGSPKGVPISFSNISYFLESFYNEYGKIDQTDRVLQMFELTFDMSVFSYLLPWLSGATLVSLHREETKFLQILDLLEANKITVAFMVPSIVNLIQPYIDPEIKNTSLRLNIFAGEPLLAKQIDFWKDFVCNADIYNAYGPTENTIICTSYKVENNPKQRNGILSIGKPMLNNDIRFLNKNDKEGELLLGGKLLTKHYWKNKEKDKEAFLETDGKKFYKTGDWCERDDEGNIYYINRIDFQAKINGFRVELSEVDYFANQIINKGLSVTIVHKDKNNNDNLIIFIEDFEVEEKELLAHLKENLPEYAIPAKIVKIKNLPLNASGKIDRNELKKQLL